MLFEVPPLSVIQFLRGWTVLGWELWGQGFLHIGKVQSYTHVNVLADYNPTQFWYIHFTGVFLVVKDKWCALKNKIIQIFPLIKLKLDHPAYLNPKRDSCSKDLIYCSKLLGNKKLYYRAIEHTTDWILCPCVVLILFGSYARTLLSEEIQPKGYLQSEWE